MEQNSTSNEVKYCNRLHRRVLKYSKISQRGGGTPPQAAIKHCSLSPPNKNPPCQWVRPSPAQNPRRAPVAPADGTPPRALRLAPGPHANREVLPPPATRSFGAIRSVDHVFKLIHPFSSLTVSYCSEPLFSLKSWIHT